MAWLIAVLVLALVALIGHGLIVWLGDNYVNGGKDNVG